MGLTFFALALGFHICLKKAGIKYCFFDTTAHLLREIWYLPRAL